MNKYFYIIVTVIMAMLVGVLIGICVGMNLKSSVINTGDTYEYYNQDIDPGMELNPWES